VAITWKPENTIDVLPAAAALAFVQSGEDSDRGVQAGEDIDKRDTDLGGFTARLAGDAHQSADGLDEEVISRQLGVAAEA